MGSGLSSQDAKTIPANVYGAAYNMTLQFPEQNFWLPDIVIDESLLKYSGLDSNSVLQTYSNELVRDVPGYVDRLGSSLSAVKSVPNAVGIGALVLSIIMEICIKSYSQTDDDSYSMLRRVFGEEKASSVRDTMSQYVKRHKMFINNEQRLQEELKRLERKLSDDLTTLKNSLLLDGQMSTRGLKIWVNGAFFHVQMMVHETRLSNRRGQQLTSHVTSITNTINEYLQGLDMLLPNYKTFKISKTLIRCSSWFAEVTCCITDTELGWKFNHCPRGDDFAEPYMNEVFSRYEPIRGLKSRFSNIKNNLYSLIRQHSTFTLPSTA